MAECTSSDSSLLPNSGLVVRIKRSILSDSGKVFGLTNENEAMHQGNQTRLVMKDMGQNDEVIDQSEEDYIDVVTGQDNCDQRAMIIDQDTVNNHSRRPPSHHCRRRSIATEVLSGGWGWLAPGWGWLLSKDKNLLSVSSARTRPIQKHATNRRMPYMLVQNQPTEDKESMTAQTCPWRKDSVYPKAKQTCLQAIRRQQEEEMTQMRHIEEKENSNLGEEKKTQKCKCTQNEIQEKERPRPMLAEQRIVQLQQKLSHEKLADQQLAQQMINEERLFQQNMAPQKQCVVEETTEKSW